MEHLENMTPDASENTPEKKAKALEKANESFFDWCAENSNLVFWSLALVLLLFPWLIPPLLVFFVCLAVILTIINALVP